jgi:RimJ/RimL family protein N-acetyltransferase
MRDLVGAYDHRLAGRGADQPDADAHAAACDPANVASRRVLEKIGMKYEGHLRDYLHIRGEKRDRLLFAALHP